MQVGSTIPESRPLRRRAIRWLAAGVWLVYLGGPFLQLLRRQDDWRKALGLLGLGVFVALYLWTIGRGVGYLWEESWNSRPWLRWGVITALLLAALAVVPGAGSQALTFLVFVAAVGMSLLPAAQGFTLLAVLYVVAEGSGRIIPGWRPGNDGFAVLLGGLATWAFRMSRIRLRRLIAAEHDLGELALEEQRSRIARDLHDILGHSLTVISVKAELARRLLDVDIERTRSELDDLEALARDALADVRATALGVRGVSLSGEIATARAALESAGVQADLPTTTDGIPSRWRELFAWTVREGVTNVIRHSNADHCRIILDTRGISVIDDGVCRTVPFDVDRAATGRPAPDHAVKTATTLDVRVDTGSGSEPAASAAGDEPVTQGHGLAGLRQRASLAGARMEAGPRSDGAGFMLRVEVPA